MRFGLQGTTKCQRAGRRSLVWLACSDYLLLENMRPGTLLISQPFLGDPNFARSVVLLCRDEPEHGSFGLVLNRLTSITLGDVLDLPPQVGSGAAELPLYVGGPSSPIRCTTYTAKPTCPEPMTWARTCIGAAILSCCWA